MKKTFKLIVFIVLFSFFIFPKSVYAIGEGETKKLYMNFNILENGDIKVYEVAELKPNYNGRYRLLSYKNLNTNIFTGKKEDFSGSSIYNADDITDIRISDVDINTVKPNNLNNLSLGPEYILDFNAKVGVSGVYQAENRSDGIYFKIFNPSNTNRAFYMEYTYVNAAVVHNDIAEVAWNILGDSYEDKIEELVVYVNLPKSDSDMRVWLHGPLDGNVDKVDDQTAKITYNNLRPGNAISFRMMFDKSIVSSSTKFSRVDGKDNILEYEQKMADEANAQRLLARIVQFIIKLLTIIWYVAVSILVYFTIKDRKKRNKCDFDMDYYRDFPGEYGPEVLEYLIKKNVTDLSLSASLLNVINKGAIKVESNPNDKKDFTFSKIEEKVDVLSESEVLLEHIIFDIIGKGNSVGLKQMKNYGKKYDPKNTFLKAYEKWRKQVIKDAKKEKFFIGSPKICVATVVVSILGCIITFINAIYESNFVFGYIAMLVGIIIALIFGMMQYRSPKGVLHHKQWMAFKKFLQDFGTMDEKELPEIIIWEKYLVYATVLGCAEKLEKDMKTRFDQMNIDNSIYSDVYYSNYYHRMFIYDSLSSGVRSSVHRSYSNSVSSQIASSTNSSGGGFGGGASGGGGSFGGGGGGGHF